MGIALQTLTPTRRKLTHVGPQDMQQPSPKAVLYI